MSVAAEFDSAARILEEQEAGLHEGDGAFHPHAMT